MAVLTAAARAAIPASRYGGPNRSFPIEDANHARAALADAPKALAHGSINAKQKSHIDAMARALLKQ